MVGSTPLLREVTGGVDTHADTHTVAALDELGRLLGHQQFPATSAGYSELDAWLTSLGQVVAIGMEGTGSYGAGLFQHLRRNGMRIIEVDQPDRGARRKTGKSDPADAIAAARAVQAGRATGTPKTRDGVVESIRTLRVPRNGASKAHTASINTLRQTLITAPAELREQLSGLGPKALVDTCARLRPGDIREPGQAAKATLRRLARRCQMPADEIAETDQDLTLLITLLIGRKAPELLAVYGVGTDIAGQLLVTAGDNADRLKSEASFAALCGVSPLLASSGKTNRHRLNRGGDRAANSAPHRVAIVRMKSHPQTRAYVERRTREGLSKREIIRCLKRYVARELFPYIDATTREQPDLKPPRSPLEDL
jgi:transposase